MEQPVEKILEVCRRINNGRTLMSVFAAMCDEVRELRDEISIATFGGIPGADGVVGESVDVILCAVDAIYQADPNITKEQILEVVMKKLEKWERVYGTNNGSVPSQS